MAYKRKKSFFTEGLPISSKWKLFGVITFFVLLIFNHNIGNLLPGLNYPYKSLVTIFFLICFVVVSIGSVVTEGIVIGLSIFAIFSNVWDFSVFDTSPLRQQILFGSIGVLVVAVSFGKVSFWNLVSIVRGQLGVSKGRRR